MMKKLKLLLLAFISIFAVSCDLFEDEDEFTDDTIKYTGVISSSALSADTQGVEITISYSDDGTSVDMSITGAQFNDDMPTFITFDFIEVPYSNGTISKSGLVTAYYEGVPYSSKGTFHNFEFSVDSDGLVGSFEICSDTYDLDYVPYYFTSTSSSVVEPDDTTTNDSTSSSWAGYEYTGTFGLEDGTYTQDGDVIYNVYFDESGESNTVSLALNDILFEGMPAEYATDLILESLPCMEVVTGRYVISVSDTSIEVGSYEVTAISISFTEDSIAGTITLNTGSVYSISGAAGDDDLDDLPSTSTGISFEYEGSFSLQDGDYSQEDVTYNANFNTDATLDIVLNSIVFNGMPAEYATDLTLPSLTYDNYALMDDETIYYKATNSSASISAGSFTITAYDITVSENSIMGTITLSTGSVYSLEGYRVLYGTSSGPDITVYSTGAFGTADESYTMDEEIMVTTYVYSDSNNLTIMMDGVKFSSFMSGIELTFMNLACNITDDRNFSVDGVADFYPYSSMSQVEEFGKVSNLKFTVEELIITELSFMLDGAEYSFVENVPTLVASM